MTTIEALPQVPLLGPEICFNATDDNDNRLIDEGCEVRQGQVQVAIAWSETDADVDLLVIGPEGEVARDGDKTHAGLVHSGDCPALDRTCPGHRFESVHLDGEEVPAGRYLIRVRLESAQRPEHLADVPLQVRLGIRTPLATTGHLVAFRALGAEWVQSFEITAVGDTESPRKPELAPGTAADVPVARTDERK